MHLHTQITGAIFRGFADGKSYEAGDLHDFGAKFVGHYPSFSMYDAHGEFDRDLWRAINDQVKAWGFAEGTWERTKNGVIVPMQFPVR